MVGLCVRQHEQVEPLDAGLGQPAQDRPAGRTGVDEHRDAVALEQHRVPLADVEEGDDELAGRRRRGPHAERLDAEGDRGDGDRREQDAQPHAAAVAASRRRPSTADRLRRAACAPGSGRRGAGAQRATAAATGSAYAAASPSGPRSRTSTAASGAAAAPCATHSR